MNQTFFQREARRCTSVPFLKRRPNRQEADRRCCLKNVDPFSQSMDAARKWIGKMLFAMRGDLFPQKWNSVETEWPETFPGRENWRVIRSRLAENMPRCLFRRYFPVLIHSETRFQNGSETAVKIFRMEKEPRSTLVFPEGRMHRVCCFRSGNVFRDRMLDPVRDTAS